MGPENVSIFPDATLIESGTKPVLNYTANFADQCEFSLDTVSWRLLPDLAGIIPDEWLVPITSPTMYYLNCSDREGGFTTAQVEVRVGELFLCPDSIPVIRPNDTLQFRAWWYEGSVEATCGTVESFGGVDVTERILGTELWETEWSADGVVLDLDGSTAGLVRGVGLGIGTVSVRHRPEGSTLRFAQSESVRVARPVTCWSCNDSTSRCSSGTQWDTVNDPPRCSSTTFSTAASCRFSCSKKRWEEVAP
jgi:hypothetical protein